MSAVLRNIPKHHVSRPERTVGSRCLILSWLSCGTVSPLFDFFMKCSPTFAVVILHNKKDLSDHLQLWKDDESESIASVMTASSRSVMINLFQLICNSYIFEVS